MPAGFLPAHAAPAGCRIHPVYAATAHDGSFLESNGYAGQIVLFNGTNASRESGQIIDQWLKANIESGRVTGSRAIDSRTALVEYFRDHATVMLATEAAAEGVNLQFCSPVVNYDLPWNPQRIDQSRIQQTIRELEATKRKQRQEIFAAEDQILEKRDQLIEALHRRMSQKTSRTRLFMIRWEVV